MCCTEAIDNGFIDPNAEVRFGAGFWGETRRVRVKFMGFRWDLAKNKCEMSSSNGDQFGISRYFTGDLMA